jgi:hypothetical protein
MASLHAHDGSAEAFVSDFSDPVSELPDNSLVTVFLTLLKTPCGFVGIAKNRHKASAKTDFFIGK